MAGNQQPHEGLGDDFFEQILAGQPSYGGGGAGGGGGGGEMVGSSLPVIMGLQLGTNTHVGTVAGLRTSNGNNHGTNMGILPLGLNLEDHSFLRHQEVAGGGGSGFDARNNGNNVSPSTVSGINDRDSLHMTSLFPALGHMQIPGMRPNAPQQAPPPLHQTFQAASSPGAAGAAAHPPTIRPRVRARRGQATDPHSIAERLRRERIAERMKALHELVPTANKTDRAAMLDEIVDYVKFLRLQVKVLSMSRLGAAGAVAQLVADIPMGVMEGGEVMEGGAANQQLWEKWSNDGTEQHVAKLMEEDVGAAMQFLQSKALCIMPISLASAIFGHQPDAQQCHGKPDANVTA